MKSEVFSLNYKSHEVKDALWRGFLMRNGKSLQVFPLEIISEGGIPSQVIFSSLPPTVHESPSQLKVILKALHIEKLGLTLFPALVILLYGVLKQKWILQEWDALLSLVVVFCLQASMQMINDVEDHLKLLDLPTFDRQQGRGVIQLGWMSASHLNRLAWVFLGLGVSLGLALTIRTQEWRYLILGLGALLGIASYSSHTVGLKYRAWGDFFIFFMTGPALSTGWSFVAFHQWSAGLLCLSLFVGLMNWSVFHCRHTQTLEMDQSRGVLTLPIQIGFKASRWLLMALFGLAALSFLSQMMFDGVSIGLILVLFPASLLPMRQVLKLYSVSGPLSAQLSDFTDSALFTHFWVFLWVALGLFLKF